MERNAKGVVVLLKAFRRLTSRPVTFVRAFRNADERIGVVLARRVCVVNLGEVRSFRKVHPIPFNTPFKLASHNS